MKSSILSIRSPVGTSHHRVSSASKCRREGTLSAKIIITMKNDGRAGSGLEYVGYLTEYHRKVVVNNHMQNFAYLEIMVLVN